MTTIRKPTGKPVRRPPPVRQRPWFVALAIRGWRAVGPTSANRLAFRCWLARRNPFVIGIFYGLMLPGYAIRGWLHGLYEAGREWQRDRDFMLAWHRAPNIYDQFKSRGERP
jgi:hypothetical protein